MIISRKVISAAILLGLIAGCASVPPGPAPEVVRLQNDLRHAHEDPRIGPNATDELRQADSAVNVVAMDRRGTDAQLYEHHVYIADHLIRIAEAQGLARYAEIKAKDLGVERDRLLVDAKSRDLRNAQVVANTALAAADAEHRNAVIARSDAEQSRAEVDSLRADLRDLQAQQTQRGMLVTLGDFLFETDRAELKPGAARTLDGLVRALSDDPAATIQIEGHTDSTGNREHNVDLSLRRADAVKMYLNSHNIDSQRMTTQGLGPDFPVASNDSEAGRQQNRRVEVILKTRVALR